MKSLCLFVSQERECCKSAAEDSRYFSFEQCIINSHHRAPPTISLFLPPTYVFQVTYTYFFVHFYLNIIAADPEAGLDLKPMKSKQYFTLYISPKSRKAKKQKRMNMKRRFSDFINVPTPTWRRNVADEQWDVISGKLLPEVWVGVRHLDHPNPAAQSSKIHGPADFPIWCLLK